MELIFCAFIFIKSDHRMMKEVLVQSFAFPVNSIEINHETYCDVMISEEEIKQRIAELGRNHRTLPPTPRST